MNTQEKVLYYVGSLLVVAGAFLQISHFGKPLMGRGFMIGGFVLGALANSWHSRRLTERVRELETEVQQLRSAH